MESVDNNHSSLENLGESENLGVETLHPGDLGPSLGGENFFERAGLGDFRAIDKSYLIPQWMKRARRQLGSLGQLKIFLKVIKK